ncbi:MAG: hypothetical protein HRT88_22610, partial [Lentisphaeraceae bacterium]|nr:hypothetical protein [Lentisphaeraceae bacterium]
RGWYESGVVRDMTIRQNNFVLCERTAINIDPKVRSTAEATHKNIRIVQNSFYQQKLCRIVHVKNVEGLKIEGNSIYSDDKGSNGKTTKDFIHLNAVRQSSVNKNKVIAVQDSYKAYSEDQ